MMLIPWQEIAFDAGHSQGANIDPNYPNYSEGTQMFNLSQKLEGFKTRRDGNIVGLLERVLRARNAKCKYLISLHSNYPTKGVIVYYSCKRPQDKAIADTLALEISTALGIQNRGSAIRKNGNDDYYAINRYSARYGISGFIVEHGAHSELAENTEEKLNKIADVYRRLFGMNGQQPTPVQSIPIPPPSRQQPKTYTKRLLKLTSPLMRGEDVKEVQRKLKAKGYDCGSIDGYYGQKCVEAVKRLQRDFGLVSDGIVGTKTLNVLNSNSQPKKSIPKLTRLLKLTSPMMRGEDVKILQQRLNALGFNCGNADGIFGRKTQEMVKSFQRNKGLSVDGIVGNKSWQKLF